MAAALVLARAPLSAQESAAAERGRLLQITPLGFLQIGPSVEMQVRVAPAIAIGAGFRIINAGVLANLLYDDLRFTWTGIVNAIWYPRRQFTGWYLAPRVEIGRSNREYYTSKLLAGANEIGYRWIKPSGVSWSVGVIGGVSRSNYTHKTQPEDTGTSYQVLAMGVIGFGYVF